MPNLTDNIEDYLKKLISLSPRQYIEIQRGELAGKFGCVPSQINYVLERRFTLERGYLVESKRGGGGCIRIYRIEPVQNRPWQEVLAAMESEDFEPRRIRQLISRMYDEKIISRREAHLLQTVLQDRIYRSCNINLNQARILQRSLLGAVLEEFLKGSYQ